MHAVSENIHCIHEGGDPVEIKFLTTSEVARLFRCKPSTIRRWCDEGVFSDARKPRGYWLIAEAAAHQLLASGGPR